MEEPLDLTKIWNAVKPQDVSKTYLPCKMIDDKEVMLAQGEESGGKADEIFMDMSLPKLSVNFNHSSNHQEDILASTNSHLAIIEQLQDQNKEMLKDIAEMKLVVTRIQEQVLIDEFLFVFVMTNIFTLFSALVSQIFEQFCASWNRLGFFCCRVSILFFSLNLL